MTSTILNMTFCDDAVPMDVDDSSVVTTAAFPVDNKYQDVVASKFSDKEIQKICTSCYHKNVMACRNKNYPLNRFLLQRNLTRMLREAILPK